MLSKSKVALVIVAVALALAVPRIALCQKYSLKAASPGAANGELIVNIAQSPKGGGKDVIPAANTVTSKDLWEVRVYRNIGNNRVPDESISLISVNTAPNYARTGEVLLTTSADSRLDPATEPSLVVIINFFGGGGFATIKIPADAASSSSTSTSGSTVGCGSGPAPHQPGTSYFDYCLSGIWIPQVGTHPLYSTNSNFSVAHSLGSGSIGLRAQESADSSAVLDPNAFSSAIFYQKILSDEPSFPHLSGVFFNWNLATVEFDRKKKNSNLGTNVNLITSPEFLLPFSMGQYGGSEIDAGIETGHNFKNNLNPNGFGTVFRGLLGAQYEKIFSPPKHLSALKQIKMTSQYQVRLLAENEVITRSIRGKLVPFAGHQARNRVSNEVDFMFTQNFGLTLKHDYGAMPPGFVFVENRATVGLTIQSAKK